MTDAITIINRYARRPATTSEDTFRELRLDDIDRLCIAHDIETADLDVIDAVARGHSRKPGEQYDYCQRLAPRALRFAELFGRQRWPGWDVWGNEADKFQPEAEV